MRSLVFAVAVLVGSTAYGQCINGQCALRSRTTASATVREMPILNRTVATSQVVSQGPIFTGPVGHVVSGVVAPVVAVVRPVAHSCPNCQRSQVYANASATSSGSSLQAQAHAEASLMHNRRIRGHVGGTLGNFEGVGFSQKGQPSTCTPPQPWKYRLAADATVSGPNGNYRVRAWTRVQR